MMFFGQRPDPPPEFGADLTRGEAGYSEQQALKAVREKISEMIAKGQQPKSDDFEKLWGQYKEAFRMAQHGKCGYCDREIGSTQSGDVEHFRPKALVTDGKKKIAPGYWWMAYSWENWLYACEICNRKYKKNAFPVRQRLPLKPGVESQEEALLLDPFTVDPRSHLKYRADGKIEGTTPEGDRTIGTCGLYRKPLKDKREQTAASVQRHLDDFTHYLLTGNADALKRTAQHLKESFNPAHDFAGMSAYLINESDAWRKLFGEAEVGKTSSSPC